MKSILLIATCLFLMTANFVDAQSCNSSTDLIISTNETWDISSKGSNYIVNKNICIQSGASLTISGINILMNGFYGINVLEGGELNISNAAIKPNTGVSFWLGITVFGDHTTKLCNESSQTLNTSNHGKLYMDYALIDRAYIGLILQSSTDNTKSGGIFNINNSSFYDNIARCIVARYQDSANLSCRINSVANTKFVTANPSNGSPDYFIRIEDYKSITILGCDFEVYTPNQTNTKGILCKGLDASGLVLEASEYVNPFNGQNSTKLAQPKRNTFQNLRVGVEFEGDSTVTPFQSIIKNCDFNQVKIGISCILATDIKILCNKYNAESFSNDLALSINIQPVVVDANGDTLAFPQQLPVNATSVFVFCEDTYTNIDILNNECNFDGDFNDTPAYGIIMLPQYYNNTGNYNIDNNIIRYTGTEGNLVTGMLFHGDYTWSPQLRNNKFYSLNKDLQLISAFLPVGNSCYLPVLGNQGIYYEGTPQEFTVSNGNIFSNPAGHYQGNIETNASLVYYTVPNPTGGPKYKPTQINSSCVSVPIVTSLFAQQNADCTVPPVSGLLNIKKASNGSKPNICFKVSPNPASTYIEVDFEPLENKIRYSNKTLTLFNSLLQPIYSATIEKDISIYKIPIDDLQNGIYILSLQDNGVVICSQKIIKQ